MFGSYAYTFVPKDHCTVLEKKSEKLVFVGLSTTSKGYRVLNPKNNKIMEIVDVRFNEMTIFNHIETKIEETMYGP